MKVLIDIPESILENIKEFEMIVDDDNSDVADCILNGIPIPDNATNGDMIKTMFPSIKIDFETYTKSEVVHFRDGDAEFSHDWWNAPYKVESEVKE